MKLGFFLYKITDPWHRWWRHHDVISADLFIIIVSSFLPILVTIGWSYHTNKPQKDIFLKKSVTCDRDDDVIMTSLSEGPKKNPAGRAPKFGKDRITDKVRKGYFLYKIIDLWHWWWRHHDVISADSFIIIVSLLLPILVTIGSSYHTNKAQKDVFLKKSVTRDRGDDVIMTSFDLLRPYSYTNNPTKFDGYGM